MTAAMEGIRLITFDGDDTLWDFESAMRNALARTLDFLSERRPAAAAALSVETMARLRDEAAGELRPRGASLLKVRLEGFRRALMSAGAADEVLASNLLEEYRHHRHSAVDAFPDAAPTLEKLRQRFAIGLVTNGNTDPAVCGLAELIDFSVYSDDHPFEKPDPRIFDVALAEAGCVTGEAIHAGDSLVDDVGGAQAAGIRAAWLDRKSAGDTGNYVPDHIISSLAELPGLLGLTNQ